MEVITIYPERGPLGFYASAPKGEEECFPYHTRSSAPLQGKVHKNSHPKGQNFGDIVLNQPLDGSELLLYNTSIEQTFESLGCGSPRRWGVEDAAPYGFRNDHRFGHSEEGDSPTWESVPWRYGLPRRWGVEDAAPYGMSFG